MVKTLISILISLGLLLGFSIFEHKFVVHNFELLKQTLISLHDKTEDHTVTYEDGTAVRALWEQKKKSLQVWFPHSALLEFDYQLYEAVGLIYVQDYESALPKIEVVLGMCENIPHAYMLRTENLF